MTATASDRTAGWSATVSGEISVLAARGGDRPLVAVATDDGATWMLDAEGTVLAHADCGVDVPTGIAVHPTRDQVAVTGARGYAVWERESEPMRHSALWSSGVAYNLTGDLAVAAGRTVVIHAEAGERYVSGDAPSTITGVAWTAYGNRVAASAYGGVYVYDGTAPDPVATHPYAGSHLAVAVNPNGRWVTSGNQDASVHIWRTADNDELEMAGYPAKVTRLAFDPTGRWFANNGAPELTVWDFLGKGPRGRKPRLLTGHEDVVDLAWRPTGGSVLASVGGEGTARVWELTGMAEGKTRKAQNVLPFDDVLAVRWLDAEHLVLARAGGAVDLVDRRS